MKKKPKKRKAQIVRARVSDGELERIQRNADEYQGGNLSAWLRRAAKFYKPDRD